MNKETKSIHLKTIHCYGTDEIDGDELYLKFDGERIWPVTGHYIKLVTDTKVVIEINITDMNTDELVEIELWDYDLLSRNDLLGHFRFRLDDTHHGPTYHTDLTKNIREGDRASYTLFWEVL